ncbi:hypothetical protein FRC17_007986, partial [Serendipita sp. 399]
VNIHRHTTLRNPTRNTFSIRTASSLSPVVVRHHRDRPRPAQSKATPTLNPSHKPSHLRSESSNTSDSHPN